MLIVLLCAFACGKASAQAPDLVITPSATLVPITDSGVLKPAGMAYDSAGNLYVADARGHVVRRLSTNGQWTTIAGNGRQGFAGDGGSAIAAELDTPMGVVIAANGALYIADSHNHKVRLVSPNGIISTIAGSSGSGGRGDGGPAIQATLRLPVALALGADGSVYIADAADHRIRRVDASGVISTVAGIGEQGFSGDEGPATLARIDSPNSLAFDSDGRLFFADRRNHRIRRIDTDGTIHSVAGNGTAMGKGDGLALRTPLAMPRGVSVDANGDLFVADTKGQTVFVVGTNASIGTAIGNGEQTANVTQGDVRGVALNEPGTVVMNQAGAMTMSAKGSSRILQTDAASMNFGTIAMGSSGATQNINFENRGDASLRIDAVDVPSGFAVMDVNCGAFPVAVAPHHNCAMAISFQPGNVGEYAGKIEVTGNVPTQSLKLQGSASASQDTLTPTTTTLDAGGTVVFTNAPLSLTARVRTANNDTPTGSVTFYDGQTQLGTAILQAGGALYSGAPLTTGVHSLSTVYSGDASYAPSRSTVLTITVSLASDFSLALAAGSAGGASQTITAGQSALYQLTLTPLNGAFTQLVTLSATGLPAGAVASFDPPALVPGASPATVVLTLKTAAHTARSEDGAAMAALCFGVVLLRLQRKRKIVSVGFATLLLIVGCGGGYRTGTGDATAPSAGTPYTVMLTATAAGTNGAVVAHSMVVTLIVQ